MSTRWLAIGAIAAVLLATGLYGYRVGWFGASDDEIAPPSPRKVGGAPAARQVISHDDAIARAAWGTPPGTPLVGVGEAVSDASPTHTTFAVADGRANVGIRVPRAKSDGRPYNGYSIEFRAGDRRLWSTLIPAAEKGGADAIGLSVNLAVLHAAGADAEPLSVHVDGTSMRKGDTLGIVRLELPATP